MGVTSAFAQLMGKPFACQLSEYMRTVVYRVPGLIIREGHLSHIMVEETPDFRASIVTDPQSYLRESDFSDQFDLDVNFPATVLEKCGNGDSSSGNDIFVVIQLKEDMCSFQATDGQCIKIEHDGIDELAIVDCDDAPAPHPDQRESSVNRVLAAARAGLGVTGEFESVLDRNCYKTNDGKCLHELRVEIGVANLTVLNPLSLEDLAARSEVVRELTARIEEDIEVGDTGGEGKPLIVPKVFLSYSWDGAAHKQWVKQFAARLRKDGMGKR